MASRYLDRELGFATRRGAACHAAVGFSSQNPNSISFRKYASRKARGSGEYRMPFTRIYRAPSLRRTLIGSTLAGGDFPSLSRKPACVCL